MSEHSIIDWITALRNGNEQAAEKLWDKVFPELVRIARSKLAGTNKRVSDEEDVAISVFKRLCDNVDRSVLKKIENDDGLWRLLVRMTANRVVDLQRSLSAEKRGGGDVRGESVFVSTRSDRNVGLDRLDSKQDEPDFEILLIEEHNRLLDLLPDEVFKTIANLRMQGYSNVEIANKCELSERSIERKLAIIRDLWSSSFSS